jgi:hypothetical protein
MRERKSKEREKDHRERERAMRERKGKKGQREKNHLPGFKLSIQRVLKSTVLGLGTELCEIL